MIWAEEFRDKYLLHAHSPSIGRTFIIRDRSAVKADGGGYVEASKNVHNMPAVPEELRSTSPNPWSVTISHRAKDQKMKAMNAGN